tara:strand:+ start:19941 stop:20171 length:231 start_codon:yes stop_codon:yes gene_type:complete
MENAPMTTEETTKKEKEQERDEKKEEKKGEQKSDLRETMDLSEDDAEFAFFSNKEPTHSPSQSDLPANTKDEQSEE